MEIGIAYCIGGSYFGGSQGVAALNLAELLEHLGHKPHFIHLGGATRESAATPWYDELDGLAGRWPVVPLGAALAAVAAGAKRTALLIDLVGVMTTVDRQKLAERAVFFAREHGCLREIDSCVYPAVSLRRNLEGLDEIWMWDIMEEEDVEMWRTLGKHLPCRRLPFFWSATPLQAYLDRASAVWPFTTWAAGAEKVAADQPWVVHITESNMRNSNSAVIPLAIVGQVKRSSAAPLEQIIVNNGDIIKESKFFMENVFKHLQTAGLGYQFVGRQRCCDWILQPRTVVLAHNRFAPGKYFHFDCAYMGIPVVHNSEWLRRLGGVYERLYYRNNNITGAVAAFATLQQLWMAKELPQLLDVTNLRLRLADEFGFRRQVVVDAWQDALLTLGSAKVADLPIADAVNSFTEPVAPSNCNKEDSQSPEIPICFSHMWDQFQPAYNFFTLLLNAAMNAATVHLPAAARPRICGYSQAELLAAGKQPALVICGPFAETSAALFDVFPGVPKVFTTSENLPQMPQHADLLLTLGFGPSAPASAGRARHLRLPHWTIVIDWFGADNDRLVNPRLISLASCLRVDPALLSKKTKFATFVVSNPCNPVRNSAFTTLNAYKPVDSAGRLFNNIGPQIFAGLGGGGGEQAKVAFMESYKFAITYENSRAPGYVTEKLLHAKAAGCVPIYWGADEAATDFDSAGFINATGLEGDSLVAAVAAAESRWQEIAQVPAFNTQKIAEVRALFATIARHIFEKIAPLYADSIPQQLGCDGQTTEIIASDASPPNCNNSNNSGHSRLSTIYETSTNISALAAGATYTSAAFAPSIHKWLMASQRQQQIFQTSKVTVEALTNTCLLTTVAADAGMEDPKPAPTPNCSMNAETSVCFATYASAAFIPSLHKWLGAVQRQRQTFQTSKVAVFLAADITTDIIVDLKAKYQGCTFEWVPVETPADFPDLWDPKWFGWKTWIWQHLTATLTDTVVFYSDAGSVMIRIPEVAGGIALANGVCIYEDKTQKNKFWCSEEFCKELAVTEAELEQFQPIAGAVTFFTGSAIARKLFADIWAAAQKRHVLTGPKWAGVHANGQPFGHRHDQSILSILGRRAAVPWRDMRADFNDKSLRRAFLNGCSYYFHRGQFIQNLPFLGPITDSYVINLERRADRLTRFRADHSSFQRRVETWKAVDGRSISLTPALARLFKPNDFFWKKAVMGCALSHLGLWHQLATEPATGITYLIFEDDARAGPGFEAELAKAMASAPADFDVLYLGGVLPPNRPGLSSLTEPVSADSPWARIALNQMFGQKVPTRYMHFCAYAYVLSQAGARKLMDLIQARDGYYTSADHMMCNQVDTFNLYFLRSQPVGCTQEDDPRYQKSNFNDFSRIDGFDSDLWTNDERFSEAERAAAGAAAPLDVRAALQSLHAPAAAAATAPATPPKSRFYIIADPNNPVSFNNILEVDWLSELLGVDLQKQDLQNIVDLQIDATFTSPPICIVQRPHLPAWQTIFALWEKRQQPFYAIHLSDEYATDPINWYNLKMCKGVLRNYQRTDVPLAEHILTVPLGYAQGRGSSGSSGSSGSGSGSGSTSNRSLLWSFEGTAWVNREAKLQSLIALNAPHTLALRPEWNGVKYPANEYCQLLQSTKLVPCPKGTNVETFRFWEALEHGAIPLYVRESADDRFWAWIEKHLPLQAIPIWELAGEAAQIITANSAVYEAYRTHLMSAWASWKVTLCKSVREIIPL